MSKTLRLTVDISEELHSEFKSIAAKQGIAISAVIRMLILQWLARQEQKEENRQDENLD